MAQINGADARIIIRPETTFKTLPIVAVHPCEAAFDETVDADITVSLDAAVYKAGTKSNKFVIADGASAGDLATDAVTAKNLTNCTKLGFWYRSSIALAAGDLQILLDDTASCASPIETLDVPAVAAGEVNTWKYAKVALVTPASLTAVISIGLKYTVDKGAMSFWLDDVRGLEGDAIIIPFNSAELGMDEALEESGAISSGRQPQMPTGGAISGAGSTKHEMNPYLTTLLKHLFGTVATSDLGGGKYSHLFTIGSLPAGLAVEVQHTVENIYTVYHAKINTGSFSQQATGKVMLDLGWEVGAEEDATNQTTLDGDPTNYGHKPFSAKFGVFTEGGVAASGLATNLKVDYNNNVEGEPTIGSEGVKDSLTEGRAKIDFSVDMLYKDNTYMDKAKALTESSLKLENLNGTGDGSANNEYMSIELPETKYARPKQRIDGPRGMKATFAGIAYFDDDAGGESIEVVIKNTQSAVA